MPLVCQMAVERLPEDKGRFAVAYIHSFDVRKACAEAHVPLKDGMAWRDEPEVVTAIRLMSDKGMQAQGISYEWLLAEAKDMYLKSAGKIPARTINRKTGDIVEDLIFDGFTAVKAHENLAKLCGYMGQGTTVNVNVSTMSKNDRESALENLLSALEARQNAGVVDAEFKELPEPSEPVHKDMLFD